MFKIFKTSLISFIICLFLINFLTCCRQVSKCNKVDCGMNARQSSYLPSVHHVMGHVTRDNCPSNKNAASSVRTYNQPSHVTSAKRKRKGIRKKKEIRNCRNNCLFY